MTYSGRYLSISSAMIPVEGLPSERRVKSTNRAIRLRPSLAGTMSVLYFSAEAVKWDVAETADQILPVVPSCLVLSVHGKSPLALTNATAVLSGAKLIRPPAVLDCR